MSEPSEDPRPPPFGRFFLPGPTEVSPDILQAQASALISHRGAPMAALMDELQEGLKQVFKTRRPVIVSTSSATGLMEAAIRNGVRARVLCLVNGAFSQRFADVARACGAEVETLEVPWGLCHSPLDLAARLADKVYDAVTICHSETSTGALNPVEDLARVVAGSDDTVLLVDSVSSLGGVPIYSDEWAVDFLLTGSQKALALPPGLSFAVASENMMERSAELSGKGMYFDLVQIQSSLAKAQTHTTPALSLMYALRGQLRHMLEEGMEVRWSRHQDMAERCWEWVDWMRDTRNVDVSVLAERGNRSPTVSCIKLGDGLEGPEVVRRMAERGYTIGGGYGKLKPDHVRVGHMGEHTVAELEELLGVLEVVLSS